MKISELLQTLLDLSTDKPSIETGIETDQPEVADGVFLPPLQLNTELMKKAVGVDNVIDDEAGGDDCGCDDEEYSDDWQELAVDPDDQLQAIRRNAGLPIDAEVENPAAIVISQGGQAPQF